VIDKFRPVDILVNTPGVRDISGLFPFVAVYQLWIVSAHRLGKDVRTLRGETSLLNATLLPPDSKTGRAGHFASQTTRLSSSSTILEGEHIPPQRSLRSLLPLKKRQS
jgi:hypothetical protein